MTTGQHAADLQVSNLSIEVATNQGWASVVDDVDLRIASGEIHGLVGESGSGKSLTAMAIMGLVRSMSHVRVTNGSVELGGVDLLSLSKRELRKRQGVELAMVFQEPMTSLNPAFTVGEQIAESMRYHQGASRSEARDRAIDLLSEVGIPDAKRHASDYPHEFSGGMRQRVMLALALACGPSLLIADEPTTALDVTVQAQILELIESLVAAHGMSVMFITHDLAVVSELCDQVTVLYAGQVVETGSVSEVIGKPRHPYTEGLLRSVPTGSDAPLWWIDGAPPLPNLMPAGCRFQPRCQYAEAPCGNEIELVATVDGRLSRCVRSDELTLTGSD